MGKLSDWNRKRKEVTSSVAAEVRRTGKKFDPTRVEGRRNLMGVATAFPTAGASLVGAIGYEDIKEKGQSVIDRISGKTSEEVAKEQARKLMSAQERAEDIAKERFEYSKGEVTPYLETGKEALQMQKQMFGFEGAGEFTGKIPGLTPDMMEGYERMGIPEQLRREFLPEGPAADYEDTEAYRQSTDAIRLMGEEKQAAAAEQFGASTGFYGGRRIREAGKIGGEEAMGLATLQQDAMQNYYDRLYRSQAMRQEGAGALAGYEQYDINRQEARQAEGRARNDQNFVNMQNMLANMANPNTALQFSGQAMNQGQGMGNQLIQAQTASSNMMNQASQARTGAIHNLIGAVGTVVGGAMGAPAPTQGIMI